MGPTASGKTDLALAIAEKYPVEVISVDSALIYRDMNIGTAKPDEKFLEALPHFLIDICDPDQTYSAADFRRDALQKMKEITVRGNIPLLVGGSMLYFKVLLEGLADIPEIPVEFRDQILLEAGQKGWPALHDELGQVDPQAAERIHPNHSQRIQRALEVYRATGKSLSDYHLQHEEEQFAYQPLQIALSCDRKKLHERIKLRFEIMLQDGFIDEVEALRAKYRLHQNMPSMRAVGYRQVWQFIDGELARDELIEKGCAATRQLAKRQLTWLRKWPDLKRLEVELDSNESEREAELLLMSEIRRLCDEVSIYPLT